MDVEQLAKKLEPLMPNEVRHWLQVYRSGGPELKSIIANRILQTAKEVFGSIDKPLLSLPPQRVANGTINLGTVVYEKEKWPLGISQGELLQNVAIFGRSGSGKTNLAFHILEQLTEMGVPFLFLDWKRTGRHLLPRLKTKVRVYTPGREISPLQFNPFSIPPGIEWKVYLQQIVDILCGAFTLGEGAKSLLLKGLVACHSRSRGATPETLLEELQKLETKGRSQGWMISAVRALETLELSLGNRRGLAFEDSPQGLLNESTIVELNGLAQNVKRFLIPSLCLWIYYAKLGSQAREKLSLVILIEEAHHVLYGSRHRNESVMEMLLRQCRELGVAFIVVDQHPSLISSAALGNAFTTICLNLKDPADINKAAALSNLQDSDKRLLGGLSVGEGIVKLQDRWKEPVLVRIPHVEIDKGSVSDDDLRRYLEDRRALSSLKTSKSRPMGTLGQIRFGDKSLELEAFALLEDVLENRDDGVDVRYKRLGLSVDKGNRLKNELLRQGLVEGQLVRIGTTRKLLLRITDVARKELGISASGAGMAGRESLAHEYWKRYYVRLFREKGLEVTVEAPRRNGRADVLAEKPSENGTRAPENMAIEIETGKSDVVWNVKQDLLMGWKVLVVATDAVARAKVERELARERLLLARRVQVVLAGESVGV